MRAVEGDAVATAPRPAAPSRIPARLTRTTPRRRMAKAEVKGPHGTGAAKKEAPAQGRAEDSSRRRAGPPGGGEPRPEIETAQDEGPGEGAQRHAQERRRADDPERPRPRVAGEEVAGARRGHRAHRPPPPAPGPRGGA